MKKMIFLSALVVLLAGACTNNPDNTPSNDVPTIVTNGDWVVSYFWDKTKDETHKFSGYTFTFDDNGVFRAVKQAIVTTGTWSVNSSQTKLILFLSLADPLEEINDDWIILERSADLIKLKDDNDTHLEELHFRRQ
ncbi:MAG: hypothetical protein KF852_16270 [Saprospiraceae bacterium]|nr:hypothetical protein [Saprospiraceae bacterium]